MKGVLDQRFPIIVVDSPSKEGGVVGGVADHSQDVAVLWIHGHNSPFFSLEQAFSGHLEIEVNGEKEVISGMRFDPL